MDQFLKLSTLWLTTYLAFLITCLLLLRALKHLFPQWWRRVICDVDPDYGAWYPYNFQEA